MTLDRGAIRVRDQVVSPAAEWVVQELGVDVGGLTTKRGAAPGRGTLRAKIDEAALAVTAEPLRLELALLREREPVPRPALDDLSRRRIDATRERLVAAEGIPADRLTVAEAKAEPTPPAADGAGRVEFRVEARGD